MYRNYLANLSQCTLRHKTKIDIYKETNFRKTLKKGKVKIKEIDKEKDRNQA